MTPEEKAAALAEAKTRGLPDGWRVELDVRLSRLFCFCTSFVEDAQAFNSNLTSSVSLSNFFLVSIASTIHLFTNFSHDDDKKINSTPERFCLGRNGAAVTNN